MSVVFKPVRGLSLSSPTLVSSSAAKEASTTPLNETSWAPEGHESFAGEPCRAQLQHRGPCTTAQGVSQCRCTLGSEGGEQLPTSQMIACQEKLYIAPSLSCSQVGARPGATDPANLAIKNTLCLLSLVGLDSVSSFGSL